MQINDITISLERLNDVLCTAFDTWYGSAYAWCQVIKRIAPTSWEFEDEFRPADNAHYRHEYPLNPGGALILSVDDEVNSFRLDLPAIERGLKALAEDQEYRWCLDEILEENEDAISASIFVQFCLFGKQVFI